MRRHSPCSATSSRWVWGRRSACGGGNSLDNTLRLVHLVPTEWVLLDIRVHAVERGFGHGLVHMFAEDGTLLATASQSCIVRFWKG
ncbi:MAG: thioesterase family protein [Ilumatobacteraceae bacterium]